jgi:hypothetical protein
MALLRLTACLTLLLTLAGGARAQDAASQEERKDPPSEGFHDTLRRMQIKRAENEHKKRVADAQLAAELSAALAKEAEQSRLDRAAEKKLRDIEKAAKRIRSDAGGSDDDKPLENPPANLPDALRLMTEVSKRLSDVMSKTSRHVISAEAISEASELIRLVKLAREYLN